MIIVTGGGNAALNAQRVRQISFDAHQDLRTVLLNNLAQTLIHLSILTAGGAQYMIILQNMDTVNNMLISFNGVGAFGPPQVGFMLWANTVALDNPLSRIVFDSQQFPIDLALPGAAIYGITDVGNAFIGLWALRSVNDGTS